MAVYFVQCSESKLIKIGFSINFESRFKGLQTSSPGDLTILCVTEGGIDLEHDFHERFSESRSRGEWFRETPELIKEIKQLPRLEAFDNGDHRQNRRTFQFSFVPRKKFVQTSEVCLFCSKEFIKTRPDKQCCSKQCSTANSERKRREENEDLPFTGKLPYLERTEINHGVIDAITKTVETFQKIAITHGISKQRVYQIAERLKQEGLVVPERRYETKKPQQKKLEVMTALSDTTDRYAVIAFQCDVTVEYVQQVSRWLLKQGVDLPDRQPKEVNLKRLAIEKDIVETTISFVDLGKKYGYSNCSRIGQIAEDLRKRGVSFTERPRFGEEWGSRNYSGDKRHAKHHKQIELDIIESSMTFAEIAVKNCVAPNLVGNIAKALQKQGICFAERRAFCRPASIEKLFA